MARVSRTVQSNDRSGKFPVGLQDQDMVAPLRLEGRNGK